MMMTHSYYGGDFDGFARPNHRAPTAAHYDRPVPYTQQHDYYAPSLSQELRSEYGGRSGGTGTRTMIQEQSPERATTGSARRRIQVACSRCRRRKIKCTGDPGDGSGCSACRSTGANGNTCIFIRVGSQPLSLPGSDMTPIDTSNNATTTVQSAASYGGETTTTSYESSLYQTHGRSSYPVPPGRSEHTYDAYNTSPVDDYTYTSTAFPRHQSISNNYNAENFRPYNSGSISAAATSSSMYYEPGAAFSFGSLQAAGPFPSTPGNRLLSVPAESFTPLNMGSLHSSLPTQTVQERRLPVPFTQTYQPTSYTNVDVPQIRPLGSFSEPQNRLHISGIHSRSGMTWSADSTHVSATSRTGSANTLPAALTHGLPIPSSHGSSSSLMGEPILGYQFSATSMSPGVSPSTGTTLPGSFSSTSTSSATSSMLPPSNVRYSTGSSHFGPVAMTGNEELQVRPSSSREAAATSLYSFSTGVDTPDRSTSDQYHLATRSTDDSQLQLSTTPQRSYPSIRHPQPHHAVSVDELRRRSSYDQRAATAHRMSVSSLNARY